MRMKPSDRFFVFVSPDPADIKAAQKLLERAEGIEIVDQAVNTFRIRTTQSFADAFKIAHSNWAVTPEHWVPKPGVRRPGIKRSPD